ncbi:MAG: hypothetical protein NZ949_07610 [Candidatus Kapabacteria bacterium]|nr:hypothetical protein [Candidatus Kapabacteria bacterium]
MVHHLNYSIVVDISGKCNDAAGILPLLRKARQGSSCGPGKDNHSPSMDGRTNVEQDFRAGVPIHTAYE